MIYLTIMTNQFHLRKNLNNFTNQYNKDQFRDAYIRLENLLEEEKYVVVYDTKIFDNDRSSYLLTDGQWLFRDYIGNLDPALNLVRDGLGSIPNAIIVKPRDKDGLLGQYKGKTWRLRINDPLAIVAFGEWDLDQDGTIEFGAKIYHMYFYPNIRNNTLSYSGPEVVRHVVLAD